MYKPDMLYNGTTLDWTGHGQFKATSGLPGLQAAAEQSHAEGGPIPEGLYFFPLFIAPRDATGTGRKGQLDTREGIEHVPAVWRYQELGFGNNAWGPDRVRLTTLRIDDPRHRHRAGFYLHDSTKGFSHGCIEVDPLFFQRLRDYVKQQNSRRDGRKRLYLRVKYPSPTASTDGHTKAP